MDQSTLDAERACHAALDRELAEIPSTLAKLALLSLCRDPETGYYRHQRLSATHGEVVAANVLRRCHEELFLDWLVLSLASQKQDVNTFLRNSLTPPWGVLLNAPVEQYAWLMPACALEVERDRFLSDLRVVLSMNAAAGVTGLANNQTGKRFWECVCSPCGEAETATSVEGTVKRQSCPADRSRMLRIVIADDDEVVRQGVRKMIETVPDFNVVGEARNGRETIQMAAESAADLVIMEINMPEVNGVEATCAIVQSVPHCQVLILTTQQSEQRVRQVLRAGARGYLLKSDGPHELIRAIRVVQNHQVCFTAHVSELLLSWFLESASKPSEPVSGHLLTAREREIIQLLVEGNSNKQAAAALGISPKTVETHRLRIMAKLNLRTFGELVRYAIRNGIAGI